MKAHYSEPELQEIKRQAHYYLGCVLYEGKLDFDAAVSELEEAVSQDPENAGAHYHLGQAIRQQIEVNKMKRLEEVWRRYLSKGVPLGHEEEVRRYLKIRLGYGAE